MVSLYVQLYNSVNPIENTKSPRKRAFFCLSILEWWTRYALSYPHEFLLPSPRVFFTMGEGHGMRAYTLTPFPSPKIKAFWERGIILLKIRGDISALRFAHPTFSNLGNFIHNMTEQLCCTFRIINSRMRLRNIERNFDCSSGSSQDRFTQGNR